MSSVAAPTDELRAELARSLGQGIAELERRPCAYRTSFGLEELDVRLSDGSRLRAMFKDLSRGSLDDHALRAKPAFLHDPLREIEVYRDLLDGAGLGTAAYLGSHVDAARERYWLFIENVEGPVLWQLGEFDVWEEAARRLAELHAVLAPAAASPPPSLLRYGPELFDVWIRRAEDFARRPQTPWSDDQRAQVLDLGERYAPIAEHLATLPAILIHGEFYPSNILVQDPAGDPRICPIDWEIAATGPGLLDLAALTIGKWTPGERDALALAYREAAAEHSARLVLPEDFARTLECCRLHLAVQWLGWDPEWVAPAEHRHDWLAEALRSAGELGL